MKFADALNIEADDLTPPNPHACHYCGGSTITIPSCDEPTVGELYERRDVFTRYCVVAGDAQKPKWVWCPRVFG